VLTVYVTTNMTAFIVHIISDNWYDCFWLLC